MGIKGGAELQRPRMRAGIRQPRAAGRGRGGTFLQSPEERGGSYLDGPGGLCDRPRKSPLPIFNTISFISTWFHWCAQQPEATLIALDSIGARSIQKRPTRPSVLSSGGSPFESTEIVMQDWSCSWKA